MALHRHFVERNDFSVKVCSDYLDGSTIEDAVDLAPNRIVRRLLRTRLKRFVNNVRYLTSWFLLPKKVHELVKAWRPDVIFTVPDNLHLGWASQVSSKYGVPLAVDFQDLFPVSQFIAKDYRPYPLVSRWLMGKFEVTSSKADAAFYTSKGMKKFFPPRDDGSVLYPIGGKLDIFPLRSAPPQNNPINLVYAGNSYGAYGRMLLELSRLLETIPRINFKIFTMGNDWSDADQQHYSEAGILMNFLPFEKLKEELEKADAFLTVMSFEDAERHFVTTSFTTKWLDYTPFGKPVFVWAPAYSTAATFSQEHGCGRSITSPNAAELIQSILDCQSNPAEWNELQESAQRISATLLNPDSIHKIFIQGISRILSSVA